MCRSWRCLPGLWLAVHVAGLGARLRAGDTAPASADEPMAGAFSMAKAAEFLDDVALDWTRARKCGTCHTNFAYLVARPLAGSEGSPDALREVRRFFESRVEHWDEADDDAKPWSDAEVVATAASLAINDNATTGRLNASTRRALDRMWALQRPDGGFTWLKCDWPPYEHDDYYGAVFATLGVGLAPEDYAQSESTRSGLAKLVSYLRTHPAPDLHHRTFLLWASLHVEGLMSEDERETTVRDLRALQREDGGWSLASLGDWKRKDGSPNPKDAPSDGYATGLIVYVLRQAGAGADDPAIREGVLWLRANQRESGRWFTRSLNNDKAHYISNAGTGFAVMALAARE